MNTPFTTSKETLENINQSASEIVELIERLGFVTETPVVDLDLQIRQIIKNNVLGD